MKSSISSGEKSWKNTLLAKARPYPENTSISQFPAVDNMICLYIHFGKDDVVNIDVSFLSTTDYN